MPRAPPVGPTFRLERGPGGGTDPAPSSCVAAVGLSSPVAASRVLVVGVWWVPLPRPGSSGTLFWAGRFPWQLFLLSILFLVAAHPAWAGAGRLLTGSCLPFAAIQGDNEVLVLVERRR